MEKENKNTAARIAANNRYNEKAYDHLNIAVKKGRKEEILQRAKEKGFNSINAFVNAAIEAYIAE